MKLYGYEKLIYNNKKHFIDWFFAEPVKVAIVVAFALADCATVFIVFDAYLPQSKYLTYVLTVLFSLGFSLIPVQLAFAMRMGTSLRAEEKDGAVVNGRRKNMIVFLLALEAFAFSAQMIGRIFTTVKVTGGTDTITIGNTGLSAESETLTAADYYGSVFLGLLPLIFGGIIFAIHYLAKENSVIEARLFNKEIERKLIENRINEQLTSLGSTEDFIHIQMARFEEQCLAMVAAANLEHIERVTASQTEIAIKNEMNPADAHNTIVEPYKLNADGSKMDI